MVYVALFLRRRGQGCFTLGAEQVSHGIASLLAALASPQTLWSFLHQASIGDPRLLLEAKGGASDLTGDRWCTRGS